MPDVTRTRIGIDRCDVLARNPVDELKRGIHSNAVATGNVERLSGNARYFTRQEVGIDDALDIREVARLKSIAVNRGLSSLQNRRDEKRQFLGCPLRGCGLLCIWRRLARSELRVRGSTGRNRTNDRESARTHLDRCY